MGSAKYISICNNDNKEWIVPDRNTMVALEIYQPSSLKGKLVKLVLPIAVKIPGFKSVFMSMVKANVCELDIAEEVKKKIEEMFGDKALTLSYFSGTPCTHQKSIIQIARGSSILGYAKYSTSEDVKKAFMKESTFLEFLNKRNVDNVPKSLFCSEYTDKMGIFIQDTKKTKLCRVEHKLNECHITFLKFLYEKTKVKLSYEQSDYYKTIQLLKTNVLSVSYLKKNREIFQKAINMVEADLKNVNCYCAYHGDFTPWNTFLEGRNLYAFDFEYAKKTYPPYLDVFHFFTQSLIFEKGYGADEIFTEYIRQFSRGSYRELFPNPALSYIQYLLSVVCLFSARDGEKLKEDDSRNMIIWIRLIEKLS